MGNFLRQSSFNIVFLVYEKCSFFWIKYQVWVLASFERKQQNYRAYSPFKLQPISWPMTNLFLLVCLFLGIWYWTQEIHY